MRESIPNQEEQPESAESIYKGGLAPQEGAGQGSEQGVAEKTSKSAQTEMTPKQKREWEEAVDADPWDPFN